MSKQYTLEAFRFSGSYVTRYMNCHGSAVLTEAIPGFQAEPKNELMTTPAGKIRASVFGTAIHSVFQEVLTRSQDLLEAAALLDELADVRGQGRTKLLKSEKEYITWWFMKNFSEPPIEFDIIKQLHIQVAEQALHDPTDDTYTVIDAVEEGATPAQIRFLAEALRYVFEIIDSMEGAQLYSEETRPAEWTATKPNTTADLIITDGERLEVVDLKLGTIPVSAFENYQLLYYAQTYKTTEDKITVHILQPKNMESWEVSNEYLESWTQEALTAEAEILAGSRILRPGTHCGFCPANPYSKGEVGKPVCPAQMEALFGKEDLSIITEED